MKYAAVECKEKLEDPNALGCANIHRSMREVNGFPREELQTARSYPLQPRPPIYMGILKPKRTSGHREHRSWFRSKWCVKRYESYLACEIASDNAHWCAMKWLSLPCVQWWPIRFYNNKNSTIKWNKKRKKVEIMPRRIKIK